MVCLGNVCMATLHKGDNDDIIIIIIIIIILFCGFVVNDLLIC